MNSIINDSVKTYYGEVLENKYDLRTSACCPIDAMPEFLKPLLKNIHPEIQQKFYGCGSPIPTCLEGKTVLDLGCGTGRDVYLLAQMVGEQGQVIGIDMTEQQLEVAKSHEEFHRQAFGFKNSNVKFSHSYIEDLRPAEIADNSIDVVVSNCVINLAANKEKVFQEIFRVLKPGGELYFSDVYADRRIPAELLDDEVLLGECLSGALYEEDFRRLMHQVGFTDFRRMEQGMIELHDADIVRKAGMINFSSQTVRAFKCELEDMCENYGHVAFYLGTIEQQPHAFDLDDHHHFRTGLPEPVCGNTAKMLTETRYKKHFTVLGDFSTHYGLFDCSNEPVNETEGRCC